MLTRFRFVIVSSLKNSRSHYPPKSVSSRREFGDHGSIYTAKVFRDTLAAMGITQSLSRVANCHDNAPMECFNGTLKVEALYNTSFPGSDRTSFLERNEMISRFIDFYNKERPHSVLQNRTPLEFTALGCKHEIEESSVSGH